jgi:hypothetical protein
MRLKKADIVKFVDDAIDRAREAHARKNKDSADSAKKETENWQTAVGPRWDDVIKTLVSARKRGAIISYDMFDPVRTSSYRDLKFCAVFEPTAFEVPADLAGMRALLAAVSDDTVDMKALSGADVRDLYRKYGK